MFVVEMPGMWPNRSSETLKRLANVLTTGKDTRKEKLLNELSIWPIAFLGHTDAAKTT